MALFRKFFLRKTPEGLVEIAERVYVFSSCLTTDVLDEDKYRHYIEGIVTQLQECYPDASFMVYNFRGDGRNRSLLADLLSSHDMTVMDFPSQYEECPLLPMEMISHALRSGESWLSIEGQQNMLLMHCERGGWAVLAFIMAALLLYRRTYTGEQKTLEMVYRQAPRELIQLLSPLSPMPSQMRYLHYISQRNVSSEWPPVGPVNLDCVILRSMSSFIGEDGCKLMFRIGKVFSSTPKELYKQADRELIKINIDCHIQGDVVLECISTDADQVREEILFRVMFNTAFIRSNILILNRDEIDIMWDAKDRFPGEFRAEVVFSEDKGEKDIHEFYEFEEDSRKAMVLVTSDTVMISKSENLPQLSQKHSVAGLSPLLQPSPPPPPPPPPPPSALRFSPVISSAQPSPPTPPPAPAAGYCSGRDNIIASNIQKATSLSFRVLQEITKKFSDEQKIGQGTYGKVYVGMLENGKEIAVKVLHNVMPGNDDDPFQREFENLMMLEHQNIVRLVAYCYETQREPMQYRGRTIFPEKTYRALCFEFMQNGSLQKHISEEHDGLDWDTRYKIIRGTCDGLNYLHKGFKEPIYHLDLKPDNILLDKDMVPKLADFGLSKLFSNEQTRIAEGPIGTLGYLPMEYIHGQHVSNKLDIFSLGVVMIKIINGPGGHTRSFDMPRQEFLDLVQVNWRNRLQKTFSSSRSVEAYCQQVILCTEIALSCMESDRQKRPDIADIIRQLNDTTDVLDEVPEVISTINDLLFPKVTMP